MYFITGDTHGDFLRIKFFCRDFNTTKQDCMIILGDAGINYYLGKRDVKLKEDLKNLPITLFCIHGNHEERPYNIATYKTKEWNGGIVYYEEAYPNILFAKDAEIYNIDNKKCMVIGGAYSVDKDYRIINGWSWFESEQPSDEIKKECINVLEKNNWEVDVFLTHTCPINIEPRHLFLDMIDQSRVDKSTENFLQYIADNSKFKKWYYGHFHGEWTIDKYELMFNNIKEFK